MLLMFSICLISSQVYSGVVAKIIRLTSVLNIRIHLAGCNTQHPHKHWHKPSTPTHGNSTTVLQWRQGYKMNATNRRLATDHCKRARLCYSFQLHVVVFMMWLLVVYCCFLFLLLSVVQWGWGKAGCAQVSSLSAETGLQGENSHIAVPSQCYNVGNLFFLQIKH